MALPSLSDNQISTIALLVSAVSGLAAFEQLSKGARLRRRIKGNIEIMQELAPCKFKEDLTIATDRLLERFVRFERVNSLPWWTRESTFARVVLALIASLTIAVWRHALKATTAFQVGAASFVVLLLVWVGLSLAYYWRRDIRGR